MKKIFTRLFIIVSSTALSLMANSQVSNWVPVGPTNIPVNISGQINGIGRVSQIKFDPLNQARVYAVTAHAAFVSNDTTHSWTILPGTDALPSGLGCASICIDPSNTNILYLGTGDANYYNGGSGVWKSTDGGQTFAQSTTGLGNRLVIEILRSPTDPNTLLAATNAGIYKSTDAGANWTLTSPVDPITDMRINTAASSTTIYAVGRTSGMFYRSTDMGSTWTSQKVEATTPGAGARLAVTPADTSVVYLTFIGSNNSVGGIIYRSADGGLTFTQQKGNTTPNLNGYTSTTAGQGNYNYDMEADPLNANTLYVVGHLIWKSTDAGVTWTQTIANWASYIHTDMHSIRFYPHDHSKLFNGNDGGVWINTDGTAKNWTPMCLGLISSEIYHFANSHITKYLIGVGLQDNGEVFDKNGTWYSNTGGDYTTNYTTDISSNYVYYVDKGTRRDINNSPTGSSLSLGLPNAASSNNHYAFSQQNTNVAFCTQGGFGVYATSNLQTNPPTWRQVFSSTKTFSAIALSPADANIVYVMSTDKSIYRSTNALAATPSFTAVTAAPQPSGTPTNVGLTLFGSGVVYMSSNGTVFRSSDQGITWSAVGSGPVTTTLQSQKIVKLLADTSHTSLESIYAVVYQGVYYKDNTMSDWAFFSTNLPSQPGYRDIDIFYDATNLNNSRLRVASYGRGLWETALANTVAPPNQLPAVSLTSPANNKKIDALSSVLISANASDTDGYVTKVEFYQGSSLLGTATNTPYNFTWNNPPKGNYALTAKAYDNAGGVTTSAAVNISVDTMVVAGSVNPSGDAYVRDGSSANTNFGTATTLVVKNDGVGYARQSYLQFDLSTLPTSFDNATLRLNVTGINSGASGSTWQVYYVPTDSWTETGITWNNKPAPTTLLATVKAQPSGYIEWDITDQTLSEIGGDKILSLKLVSTLAGGTTDASFSSKEDATDSLRPQLITRVFKGSLPTVALISPANNTTYAAGSNVTINANAGASGSAVPSVAFYQGAAKLEDVSAAPYSTTINHIAPGNYRFNAVVTDPYGRHSHSNTIAIVVKDTIPPVIQTAAGSLDANLQCSDTAGIAAALILQPTATDEYTATPQIHLLSDTTIVSTSCSNAYTRIRSWHFTDEAGNVSSSFIQTIRVTDTIAPVINGKADTVRSGNPGVCTYTAVGNEFDVTATDNWSTVTLTYALSGATTATGSGSLQGVLFNNGTTTVTWTATDACGNSASRTQQVIVTDNELPVVKTQPVSIALVNGQATVTAQAINNGSTDNCGIASMTISKSVFGCNDIGDNTVTLTVTDTHGNVASTTAVVTVTGNVPTASVAVVPSNNTYTGGVPSNLYLGYGPSSVTLNVTATGGAPYAYSWNSNGILSNAGSNAPVFTPTTPGYYTFIATITNASGCSVQTPATAICVRDIRVPGSNGKVYLTHVPPGNNDNPHTLALDVNAVATHLLNHKNDYLGSLNQAPCNSSLNTTTATADKTSLSATEEVSGLEVTASPNPTATFFTIRISSRYEHPVTIVLTDQSGRTMETKPNLQPNSTVQLGHNLLNGSYYAEIIQGNRRKVIKLIKMKN